MEEFPFEPTAKKKEQPGCFCFKPGRPGGVLENTKLPHSSGLFSGSANCFVAPPHGEVVGVEVATPGVETSPRRRSSPNLLIAPFALGALALGRPTTYVL